MKDEKTAPKMKVHPTAELFPMMGDKELQALADDIKEKGLRHRIVCIDGVIIDGRNRLKACEIAEVEPKVREFDPQTEGDPEEYILRENVNRRHLTTSARAFVAAGFVRNEKDRGEPVEASIERLAKRFTVSARSVRRALEVHERAASPLLALVRDGRVAVSAAAMVAKLDEEDQKALAEAGADAVRKKSGELREEDAPEKGAAEDPVTAAKDAGQAVIGALREYIRALEAVPTQRLAAAACDAPTVCAGLEVIAEYCTSESSKPKPAKPGKK